MSDNTSSATVDTAKDTGSTAGERFCKDCKHVCRDRIFLFNRYRYAKCAPAVMPEAVAPRSVADEYPQLSREQIEDMNSGD